MRDSPSNHVLIVLLIPVKEVCGINTHTYRSLQITDTGIYMLLINEITYNVHRMLKYSLRYSQVNVRLAIFAFTYLWVGPLLKPSLLPLLLKTLVLISDLCRGSSSFHHLE